MVAKAILVASQPVTQDSGTSVLPGCLELLVDRPCLQHVVEQLALGGVREIDVIAGAGADAIEQQLGGGERWGVKVTHHRTDGALPAEGALSHLLEETDVLLADARVLVAADSWRGGATDGTALELLQFSRETQAGNELEWTGWARGRGDVIANAVQSRPGGGLLESLIELSGGSVASVQCPALAVRDAFELLEANRSVLSGRAPFVSLHGRAEPPGLWRERGVRIHPSARIIEPVYLGEHTRIGRDAVVGPNAVLGAGCVVDDSAVARNCVITSATYIQPGAHCEGIVGLHSGVYCTAPGDPAHPQIARALVDLRSISLFEGILTILTAWILQLVDFVTWPIRAARAEAEHLGTLQLELPNVAASVFDDNHGAALPN